MRRISTKLTVAAVVAIALVMGAHAVQRVQRESEVLNADLRRDHEVLGRALAETVGALVERAGPAEALLAVEEADQRRSHVRIAWVTTESRAESHAVEIHDGSRSLVSHVPVETTLGRMGYLELEESLEPTEAYLKDTVVRVTTVTLVMLLACALLIHGAGKVILERPLRPIVEKIRRIGAGDLEGSIGSAGDDELGVVAREIDEMSRQLDQLRRTASRETDARIAALEQLRHADRLSTVGKLAAGVAHELGTPLNVANARAKMILRGESVGDEVLDDARVIVEQTDRMTIIIRQLLDFARRRPPSREPIDLRALAASVISMMGPLGTRHRVSLDLVEGDPVEAPVDVGQLQQVMTNLLMNAIQCQPEGGAVEVALDVDGEDARVSVRDHGPGIPDDVRARVFEPFFTTKDVGAGTGLGLSVVHGILEEHGGSIRVESSEDGGARFVVRLPRRVRGDDGATRETETEP